jgi:uncharacterized protein with GYD domain
LETKLRRIERRQLANEFKKKYRPYGKVIVVQRNEDGEYEMVDIVEGPRERQNA